MNLDIFAQVNHGDAQGLQNFLLAHQFIHDQTAVALVAKFGASQSTFGLTGQLAETAWVERMQSQDKRPTPQTLQDWLEIHARIHVQTYTLLGTSAGAAPDLSTVDFADAQQFYDWMESHQQMHDFEQQSLGLT